MKGLKVIDLFAGCGGLSLGFEKNGYQIETALEYDKMIAETYKKNHSSVNVIVDDIRNVDKSGIFFEKSADIIIGGPPCQGFSMAGARIRSGFMGDPRNYLFKHYFNVVKTVRPEVFIMENVKGIMTMESGDIFNEILKILISCNKDAIKGDNLPEELWNDSLIEKDRFYYSDILHINSKLPSWNPKTFKEECPSFFLEMKIKFSMNDLLNYYYDKCRIPLALQDDKKNAGAFKHLIAKYEAFKNAPGLDYVIALINKGSEDKEKEIQSGHKYLK